MKRLGLILIVLFFTNIFAQDKITADDILNRVDQNQISSTVKSLSKMIIFYEGREMEKKMSSLAVGTERSFAEFTFPARDKGTKYLRIKDEMWMYLPSAEKIIKIAGHMLRQSMMGSDFSYEDALEQTELRKKYDAEIIGEEQVDNKDCYVLELTANTKKVTYYRRKIWVDKQRYVPLKAERYAKSGKLLKLFSVKKVEKFGERYFATHMVMEDKLRFNSRTEMIIESIEFDINIPESTFSLRNLEKR
ncbi:outer membrane lipoprotein-sorting protein [candidate division KSB1 bacterium]